MVTTNSVDCYNVRPFEFFTFKPRMTFFCEVGLEKMFASRRAGSFDYVLGLFETSTFELSVEIGERDLLNVDGL